MKRGTNIFAVIGFITTILIVSIFAYSFSKGMVSSLFGIISQKTSGAWCNRTMSYPMPPEFQRALSIIGQRVIESQKSRGSYTPPDSKKSYYYCLDIQYKDLSNEQAEGLFLFDPSSSPEDLKIYVDNSYQEYDDYLTAILLSHEITHAYQFLDEHFNGKSLGCYDKEILAFEAEKAFIVDLNNEEKMSLFQRILADPHKNSAYEGINQIGEIGGEAVKECGTNEGNCYEKSVDRQITDMVQQNPFYQKECAASN